jgi:hypothetical protein
MRRRTIVSAFIFSTILSLVVGLLSNLAATYLAPSLENKSWVVYAALLVTFMVSLPLSAYLFYKSLPQDPPSSSVTSLPPLDQKIHPVPDKPGFIPEKLYHELVGRDAIVGETMAALRDPNGKWVVGVDGIGGIGKTALAREVADICQRENLFEAIVWEQSAKESTRGLNQSVGLLTFENALDAIARQIGAVDVLQLKASEKQERIRSLIKDRRILIVLDNLETAKEDQNEITRKLLAILNPGKALLTSRHRFEGNVHGIHLSGLDSASSLRFIRSDAQEKNISRVTSASDSELNRIAQVTGGSPLAMKLVVGQLIHLPLDVILSGLKEIQFDGNSRDTEYVRFYKAIFMPSWKLLSEDAQRLLISMANFAPNIGGTYDAIKATSGLSNASLSTHIEELWRLSFLEVGKSTSLNKVRYYLHALTQYFVLSDIVKIL